MTTDRPQDQPPADAIAGPGAGPGDVKEAIAEAMCTVYDPEIPVSIYALGLIYDIAVDPAGKVDIVMTLTAPGCPVADILPAEVEQKARAVDGVSSVHVDLVFEPPWRPDMMSEAARLELGMF